MPLSDEHVVPFSLGGQHILAGASCSKCADITKRFEQHVARDMWGPARISYGAPTRRKKTRPTHIILDDLGAPGRRVRVPYSDYAPPMIFYKMHSAGLLMGLPEHVDISSSWQLVEIHDNAKAQAFQQKHGIKMVVTFRHMPDSFGRLLAKIGYCHLLTEFEPSDFVPICLPYILGRKQNISYIVGGSFDIPPPDPRFGYELSTRLFGDLQRMLVLAQIRLFGNNATPIYHVVVGEVRGPASALALMGKYGGQIERPGGPERKLEHWEPRVWPVL